MLFASFRQKEIAYKITFNRVYLPLLTNMSVVDRFRRIITMARYGVIFHAVLVDGFSDQSIN